MGLTAETVSRGHQAAAGAPLLDSVSGLQLRSSVPSSHLAHGAEELLLGVDDVGAALALRVAGADGVSGAAVTREATAAVVVALALADKVAGAATADGAGGRVVAEGRGDGGVGQEGSEEFAGEVHFEEFWIVWLSELDFWQLRKMCKYLCLNVGSRDSLVCQVKWMISLCW